MRTNWAFIVLLTIDMVLVTVVLFILLKWYGTDYCVDTVKVGSRSEVQDEPDDLGAQPDGADTDALQWQEIMVQAERLAQSYDYDGAVCMIQTIQGYGTAAELRDKIHSYETAKASCVPVNTDEVTHVFYHTLVVDPERAFANQEVDHQAAGNNQWMTTVSEFEKNTQEMYDRGYVIVGIHDLFDIATDENGSFVFQPANIMLPPGKRAYVLSQDDLSYYHCYDNYGYATKMVLNENGKPICEYIQADGTRLLGAYDLVPILDAFIEEHPDASYRGAKGVIALTGYNGILGYRTDSSYMDVAEDISREKKKWLEQHPDFDIEKERIMRDTQKWRENVEPLVGATDIIVFAHGQDLGAWGSYDESDAKYQYFREQGYRIFCNVDSNRYRTLFGRDYLRQGRSNLDGYRIYNNSIGNQSNVSDLFDAAAVLDPLRPPVQPLE